MSYAAHGAPGTLLVDSVTTSLHTFVTAVDGPAGKVLESIDIGVEWAGPGSADVQVKATIGTQPSPFWTAHQDLGTGGSLYFSWRGAIALPQAEEVSITVEAVSGGPLSIGIVCAGSFFDLQLLTP